MSRQIEVEWSDFKAAITADLLEDENPELCEAFWQRLPFRTIFAASMSAGEMFKVPIPFILPDPPAERLVHFPDQAPGTILSLSMMSSLLVKYGTVAEPFKLARLARIVPEDLDRFKVVAIKLRDAYFFTKEVNLATFKRKE